MENAIDDKLFIGDVRLWPKAALLGAAGGLSMTVLYTLILTVANSTTHAYEQFLIIWPWMTALILGFSLQVGLFAYIRGAMKSRKLNASAASSSLAASGGVSTTSMVACCAHHVADLLPVLGLSAAAVFLTRFQNVFLTVGIVANLIGITIMLKVMQENVLYPETGILRHIFRISMKKALVFNSVAGALVLSTAIVLSL